LTHSNASEEQEGGQLFWTNSPLLEPSKMTLIASMKMTRTSYKDDDNDNGQDLNQLQTKKMFISTRRPQGKNLDAMKFFL